MRQCENHKIIGKIRTNLGLCRQFVKEALYNPLVHVASLYVYLITIAKLFSPVVFEAIVVSG